MKILYMGTPDFAVLPLKVMSSASFVSYSLLVSLFENIADVSR